MEMPSCLCPGCCAGGKPGHNSGTLLPEGFITLLSKECVLSHIKL